MQCTNEDQYRTICTPLLAFDILIYLCRAYNGLVWLVCLFGLFIATCASQLSRHAPLKHIFRFAISSVACVETTRTTTVTASSKRKTKLHATKCNATRNQTSLHTGRQADRQMARPIWMNLYMFCAHNQIHTQLGMESENRAAERNDKVCRLHRDTFMWP